VEQNSRLNTGGAEATFVSDGTNWQVINEALGQVPHCSVYLSSHQTDILNQTPTLINYNTENFDIGNNFNTSTHEFTVPVDGLYHVFCIVNWGCTTADSKYFQRILKNEDVVLLMTWIQSSMASTFSALMEGNFSLSKNDTVYVRAVHYEGVDTPDVHGQPYYPLDIKLISKD